MSSVDASCKKISTVIEDRLFIPDSFRYSDRYSDWLLWAVSGWVPISVILFAYNCALLRVTGTTA